MTRVLIVIAAALGAAMYSGSAAERAVHRATIAAERAGDDEATRYLDMGVRLVVIERDDAGAPLLPGVPKVRKVREWNLGGVVDLWGEGNGGVPYKSGPSVNPVTWYCSVDQEPLILHRDDQPLWTLIQGSEGSGKTYTLAMWTAIRAIEHIGYDREIGLTVPTTKRMAHVRKAIRGLWPQHWYRWRARDLQYVFAAGPTVQLVSAHQASKDEGSPIQGANWVACGSDELQDHSEREADILARGRAAPNAKYKRLCTSTAKTSTTWRNFRAKVIESSKWLYRVVLGRKSPFIHPDHWENLRASGTMTEREFRRRVDAIDVGPENAVYYSFRRADDSGQPLNLRPIPITAVDITAEVLAQHRPQGDPRPIGLLLGHDPGKRQHVTVALKAYRFPGKDTRPRWFVVDEITTEGGTVHSHAQAVLKRIRDLWSCNTLDYKGRPSEYQPQALVRIDPHSRAEKSDHPGPDVYATWRSLGLLTKAAAYKPGSNDPGTIPIESRIDMVNTLLCATAGDESEVRRLFIACDDNGKTTAICNGRPCDSKLLATFESMERDAGGRAENEPKDKDKLSHWGCALGYALWMPEHARAGRAAA